MYELGFIPVTLVPIVWIVGAYLIGSISFGIIFSILFGLPDPRTVGSGNIGATNIARSGKKLPAILTLLGDALKGWLTVWLALQSNMLMWVVAAVGLAVFFGHLYPIYHKFKGGKGVATALGVTLAVSPMLGLACLLTWALVAFVGLNPTVHQSGSSVRGKPRLSKKGNATIRKALYMPAIVARRYNPIIKDFATRLKKAGKSNMLIIGAVMRKLLHIIYGVLKSGKPFDADYAVKNT